MGFGLLSVSIWLPIAVGVLLLALGRDDNPNASRWLALVGAIGLIGPALGPLAALAAGAFSAIAVGAAAAAMGVGVLVLALAPVISATQAVMQNQNRANTASAQAESRAFALASAQDSLKAALRGVASAQADAANAAERSDRKIADARRRVEDVVRSAVRVAGQLRLDPVPLGVREHRPPAVGEHPAAGVADEQVALEHRAAVFGEGRADDGLGAIQCGHQRFGPSDPADLWHDDGLR